MNKYRNRKTVCDGITFDSMAEARYYTELKLLQKAGVVEDIELQPKFLLQDSYKYLGRTVRAINYIADFRVTYADGHIEVVDVKGKKTEVYNLKKKLFLYRYNDIIFKEVR